MLLWGSKKRGLPEQGEAKWLFPHVREGDCADVTLLLVVFGCEQQLKTELAYTES